MSDNEFSCLLAIQLFFLLRVLLCMNAYFSACDEW